jgi:hypothetical protein
MELKTLPEIHKERSCNKVEISNEKFICYNSARIDVVAAPRNITFMSIWNEKEMTRKWKQLIAVIFNFNFILYAVYSSS